MTSNAPTAKQRSEADKIGGLVVQHLDDGEITVVERIELLYPARAQRVLYASPEPENESGNEEEPQPA